MADLLWCVFTIHIGTIFLVQRKVAFSAKTTTIKTDLIFSGLQYYDVFMCFRW